MIQQNSEAKPFELVIFVKSVYPPRVYEILQRRIMNLQVIISCFFALAIVFNFGSCKHDSARLLSTDMCVRGNVTQSFLSE